MSSLNRVILIGTIEKEPDVKVTTTGDPVANFNIKVQRPDRPDGLASQTDTFRVVAWRHLAEKREVLQAGSVVLIEGAVLTRSFEDKEGRRKWVTEIDAKEIRPVTAGEVSHSDPSFGNNSEFASFSEAFETQAPKKAAVKEAPKKASFEVKQEEKLMESDFNFGDDDNGSFQAPPEFTNDLDEEIPF